MLNPNSISWTFIFSAICCIVGSVLLAGTEVRLGDKMKENKELDQNKSVLLAAGLVDDKAKGDDIRMWFDKQKDGKAWIQPVIIDKASGKLTQNKVNLKEYLKAPDKFPEQLLVYECLKQDEECFILPIAGQGLWGALYGYLALAKDGSTVLGISFYSHIETPGLGAEIVEPWFRNQFIKKKLYTIPGDFSDKSFRGIEVKKGIKVADLPEKDRPYSVDGISGATLTGNGVMAILKSYVKQFSPYLERRVKELNLSGGQS